MRFKLDPSFIRDTNESATHLEFGSCEYALVDSSYPEWHPLPGVAIPYSCPAKNLNRHIEIVKDVLQNQALADEIGSFLILDYHFVKSFY